MLMCWCFVFKHQITYILPRFDLSCIHRHFSIIPPPPNNTRINFAHVKHHLFNSALSPSVGYTVSIHICTLYVTACSFTVINTAPVRKVGFEWTVILSVPTPLKLHSAGSWHVCNKTLCILSLICLESASACSYPFIQQLCIVSYVHNTSESACKLRCSFSSAMPIH